MQASPRTRRGWGRGRPYGGQGMALAGARPPAAGAGGGGGPMAGRGRGRGGTRGQGGEGRTTRARMAPALAGYCPSPAAKAPCSIPAGCRGVGNGRGREWAAFWTGGRAPMPAAGRRHRSPACRAAPSSLAPTGHAEGGGGTASWRTGLLVDLRGVVVAVQGGGGTASWRTGLQGECDAAQPGADAAAAPLPLGRAVLDAEPADPVPILPHAAA